VTDLYDEHIPPGAPAVPADNLLDELPEAELIQAIVGHRREISHRPAAAAKVADALVRLVRRNPRVAINLVVGGWDDDPREVLDIPEALRVFRLFARKLGELPATDRSTVEVRLTENSRVLLALATGKVRRDQIGVRELLPGWASRTVHKPLANPRPGQGAPAAPNIKVPKEPEGDA